MKDDVTTVNSNIAPYYNCNVSFIPFVFAVRRSIPVAPSRPRHEEEGLEFKRDAWRQVNRAREQFINWQKGIPTEEENQQTVQQSIVLQPPSQQIINQQSYSPQSTNQQSYSPLLINQQSSSQLSTDQQISPQPSLSDDSGNCSQDTSPVDLIFPCYIPCSTDAGT